MGPHLGTWVPMGTFFRFWVPIGSPFVLQGPHFLYFILSLSFKLKSAWKVSADTIWWWQFDNSIQMAKTLCTKWWHTLSLWILKKTLNFNELTRFGQLFKYTLLGPHFCCPGSPFHKKIRSPLGPHWKIFRSPFKMGAVNMTLKHNFWLCLD